MKDLKLINLQDGDSQKDIADKLNYNFQRILDLGGGAYGKFGERGPIGSNGILGITGPYGDQGFHGNYWFISPTEPIEGVTPGDYWINTADDCEVYRYEVTSSGYSWIDQYFYISRSGVFEISDYLTGLTSGTPSKSYVQNIFYPEKNTLVINAATGSDVKNPQLTKMVIGNTGATGSILLEFSKGDYNLTSSNLTPKVRWTSTNSMGIGDYGLDFEFPQGFSTAVRDLYLSSYSRLFVNAGTTDINDGVITSVFSNTIKFTTQGIRTLKAHGQDLRISSDNLDVNINSFSSFSNFRSTNTLTSASSRTVSFIPSDRGLLISKIAEIPVYNIFRIKHNGATPDLDRDHFLLRKDVGGGTGGITLSIDRKFSPWIKPGPGVLPNNETGTYSAPYVAIAGAPFFTVTTTPSNYAGVLQLNRYSMGDVFFPEIGSSHASTFDKALCIYISTNPGFGGFRSQIDDEHDSLTFSVVGEGNFNSIILDYGSSPSSSFTFSSTDTNFSLIDNVTLSRTVSSSFIELTIFKGSNSSFPAWEVYYTAHTEDDGTYCGHLYV